MNATTTLINDLREMSEDSTKVNTTHKEETKSRIEKDMADRLSLSKTLKGCIDLPGPDTHLNRQLIIIYTSHIATEHINIWDVVAIGTKQMEGFEKSWPEGFYVSLSKEVFTFASKKKTGKSRQ